MRSTPIACLIVLAAVGGYFVGRRTGRESRARAAPPIAAEVVGPAMRASAAAGPEPAKQTPDGASENPIRVLGALRDQHPDAVKISVLTRRDQIDPSFSALLRLTREQTAALNAALTAARGKLSALAAASATMRVEDDGAVLINVPPFEGGAAVYDQLMDAFAETLGKDSAEALQRLCGDELVQVFQHFGAERRHLIVAETLPGYVDWRDGLYYIKDERSTENEQLETVAYRFRADRMEYLPPHLQWLQPIVGSRLPPLIDRPRIKGQFFEVTDP